MMHPLGTAADLDVSVRARRLACVLDPALLLAAPHGLLLAQQLGRVLDLWVCPAFWRLLDASEFFARRPARLRAWLALGEDHPLEGIVAALDAWSRWRATRDLASLGLYWVGGHQTESFLPENGPRDVPLRFEGLMEAWLRAIEPEAVAAAGPSADPDAPAAGSPRQEGAAEPAALAVTLQVPVLTLAPAPGGEGPALVRQWADSGLAGIAWHSLHAELAAAEHARWWDALVASGAAPTVAAATCVGVRLALAHVVAPSGHAWSGGGPATEWIEDVDAGENWHEPLGAVAPSPGYPAPGAWWRDARALWMPV